jgi:hypothetical protein
MEVTRGDGWSSNDRVQLVQVRRTDLPEWLPYLCGLRRSAAAVGAGPAGCSPPHPWTTVGSRRLLTASGDPMPFVGQALADDLPSNCLAPLSKLQEGEEGVR